MPGDRVGERLVDEALGAAEHRLIGAAGEARVLLVANAERHERRVFQVEREARLGARVVLGESPRKMRMTSSDRSLRLCAFSVLSARICQAISRDRARPAR